MSLFFPTLTTVPDFSRAPRRGTSTAHDRTGMGASRQIVFFPQRRPDHLFDFRFAFTAALDITTFKEFFRARAGRCNPFYLPSWQRDLTTVGTATAGTKLIEIVSAGEDYEATHLTDTDADHYGRQLFFWKDGEVVHVDSILRVLPGSAAGQEIIDLDNPLPFDVDGDTWVGWAHLVRFSEDRLEWKHWGLRFAEVEIGFRGMRQANQNELSVDLVQEDQYGQLGFVLAEAAPGEILPVTNRVAYANGPESLRASQDDPYSMPWAAFPASDGVRLRKALPPANEVIWLPQTGGTASILFDEEVETDHIALAFDQNAYEVVAYQLNATTIECRRYFNTAVETVTWEGIDPLLQFNGLLDADLPTGDTDVVAYYLKPGENILFARFQRDNFGTEYVAALLPGRPVALKRAFFEYNEAETAGVLKVEFVDSGLRVVVVSSASYPDPPPPPIPPYVLISESDDASVDASLSGDYAYAVMWADGGGEFDPHPAFADAGSVDGALLGDYVAMVLYADGADTDLGPHPAFADFGDATASVSGVYALNVIEGEDDLAEVARVATVSITAVYALNVIFPPVSDEQANTSTSLSGVYEPA